MFDEEISQGAFCRVYIAENINNHQQYSVEIINTEEEFNRREQMIFIRESLLFQKLEHQSIVKIIGINFKSFQNRIKIEPTIITEYFPRGSKKNYLDKLELNEEMLFA